MDYCYKKIEYQEQGKQLVLDILYSFDENGFLHHSTKEALIIFYRETSPFKNESFEEKYYFKHGILYKENGPAFLASYPAHSFYQIENYHQKEKIKVSKEKITKELIENLHSIIIDPKTHHFILSVQKLLKNSSLCNKNTNASSISTYIDMGEKFTQETFWDNGKIHREGGPARIKYKDEDKKIISEEWIKEGKIHREEGPALIIYNNAEIERIEEWHLEGKKIE